MKKIALLLLLLSLSLLSFDYKTHWQEVESFKKQNLPKSALNAIKPIFEEAKKEKNEIEYIKALMERLQYIQELKEEGLLASIQNLEQEFATAPSKTARMVLNSVLAELYALYLENNRYRLLQRTSIKSSKRKDIATWSIGQLLEKTSQLYRKSLDPVTQQKKLLDYKELLKYSQLKNNIIDGLRPTLYDFLAYRALNFFGNKRNTLNQPRYNSVLQDEKAFASISVFLGHAFKEIHTKSFNYHALQIYKQLLRFHQKDGNLKALGQANLGRLYFVHKNFSRQNRDEFYLKALNQVRIHTPEALLRLARYYYQEKGDYRLGMKYAQQGLKSSDIYLQAKSQEIVNSINRESLEVEMERVNLPHENILAKIRYRNAKELFVHVRKMDDASIEKLNGLHQAEERLAFIQGLALEKELHFILPQTGDYKTHATEISLDSYTLGSYLFILSAHKSMKKSIYKLAPISNLAYLQQNSKKLLMLHRKTGQPLEGVKVSFYKYKDERYGYNPEKMLKEKAFTLKSNAQGFVLLPKRKKGSYSLYLERGEDNLDLRNESNIYLSSRTYTPNQKPFERVLLFTDRAIYRPSQSIYFKGLALRTFGNKAPEVLAHKKVKVTFYDANNQKVESQTLISDEYGTIFGTFTAPKSGRLGSMMLRADKRGGKSIQVEEYKRPKFEVSFKALDKSYHLGDRVKLTGVAKAYAGDSLDSAKVHYRIVRKTSLPWRTYWERYTPYVASKNIGSGDTTSNTRGEFTISFQTKRDTFVEAKEKPIYTYTLYVDVTDATGESHSSSKSIRLADVDIEVDLKFKKHCLVDDENKRIVIDSKNLNGEFKAVSGELIVEKLLPKAKLYRKRYWYVVDKPLYDKNQFEKLFPFYRYKVKGIDKQRKEKIARYSINTAQKKEIELNRLENGEYLITFVTQSQGESLRVSQKLLVQDPDASTPPMRSYLWAFSDKEQYSANEEAKIILQSSLPSLFVLFTLTQDQQTFKEQWVHLEGGYQFSIPLKKAYRGGVHYQSNFVYNNRVYHSDKEIKVPWDSKLNIEYISFRDKLKPNEEEQFKIKISGKNREKVMAQMLATIYDASLDTFVEHNIYMPELFPKHFLDYEMRWRADMFDISRASGSWKEANKQQLYRIFPSLKWSFRGGHREGGFGSRTSYMYAEASAVSGVVPAPSPVMNIGSNNNDIYNTGGMGGDISVESDFKKAPSQPFWDSVYVRKDLNETLLFEPKLETDSEGNIVIDFKTNGALTRWNLLGLVHSKDLRTAQIRKSFSTQKEVMVVTNLPRFFREKDIMVLREKIVNMGDKDLRGVAELSLTNPLTGQLIYGKVLKRDFFVKKGTSTTVSFKILIPDVDKYSVMKHTFIAKAKGHSDGEEMIVPILSNRTFITESKAITVKGGEAKELTLKSLKNNRSSTLKNHKLTLEFTSNPAWYAIRSLPYLMEYEHECSEQLFARYSANRLASNLLRQNPKIKAVFDSWKNRGELKSPLRGNSELKSLLLEETPWVLDAKSEEEQMKEMALLFDVEKMASQEQEALRKLEKRQHRDGGFSWFGGKRSDWYITQYIVEGMGHLKHLGIRTDENKVLQKAIAYLDVQMDRHYQDLLKAVKKKEASLEEDNLNSMLIHYLYARSFFKQKMPSASAKMARNYYLKQVQRYWGNKALYEQGLIALALKREGVDAKTIVSSIKEHALVNEELGMYFNYTSGYYWNQLPIETHTLLMEVFKEVTFDSKSVELMKVWLLKNRQSNHWKTTKATTSAIYALIDDGASLSSKEKLEISFDSNVPYEKRLKKAQLNAQEGTGYFKVSYKKFDKSMATVSVKNPNKEMAWGALYWQYFEEMDRVKSFNETPLKINKNLYKLVDTSQGQELIPLGTNSLLKVGDKVKVRIELRVDRPMEYIMMKDSRASTFEPIHVLSHYRYQDGLGYYESTKDNATYFFFDHLRKGTYVFEYPLFVNHKGKFSNGISTIESMYAPEFRGHSKGLKIEVQ